ncbi:hypothetical protein PR048_029846 [Dryococelus australis]|uniref:Uncharacterized protein n=1 Tax=Dryococelus australis TaxID=614101 RepID=A0ABQ9G799_9NEOP|nr:hypothetical protein PR048_029846 [Dryococelus australis]
MGRTGIRTQVLQMGFRRILTEPLLSVQKPVGPRWCSDQTTRLPSKRTGFDSQRGNHARRGSWSKSFLGILQLPPPLHSRAAPYLASPSSGQISAHLKPNRLRKFRGIQQPIRHEALFQNSPQIVSEPVCLYLKRATSCATRSTRCSRVWRQLAWTTIRKVTHGRCALGIAEQVRASLLYGRRVAACDTAGNTQAGQGRRAPLAWRGDPVIECGHKETPLTGYKAACRRGALPTSHRQITPPKRPDLVLPTSSCHRSRLSMVQVPQFCNVLEFSGLPLTPSRIFTPQTPRPPSSRNLPSSSSVLFADVPRCTARRSSTALSQSASTEKPPTPRPLLSQNILASPPKSSASPERGRRRDCDAILATGTRAGLPVGRGGSRWIPPARERRTLMEIALRIPKAESESQTHTKTRIEHKLEGMGHQAGTQFITQQFSQKRLGRTGQPATQDSQASLTSDLYPLTERVNSRPALSHNHDLCPVAPTFSPIRDRMILVPNQDPSSSELERSKYSVSILDPISDRDSEPRHCNRAKLVELRRTREVKEAAGKAERRMEGARVCEAELVASSIHQTAFGRAPQGLEAFRREQGSIPGGVASGFSHVGIVPDDAAVFLVYLPFLMLLHSNAAPYLHRFTLIGSQDLDREKVTNTGQWRGNHRRVSPAGRLAPFQPCNCSAAFDLRIVAGDVPQGAHCRYYMAVRGLGRPPRPLCSSLPPPPPDPNCLAAHHVHIYTWNYFPSVVVNFTGRTPPAARCAPPKAGRRNREWTIVVRSQVGILLDDWSAGFLGYLLFPPHPSFRRRSIFTDITLIAVKSHPNLFTHSQCVGLRRAILAVPQLSDDLLTPTIATEEFRATHSTPTRCDGICFILIGYRSSQHNSSHYCGTSLKKTPATSVAVLWRVAKPSGIFQEFINASGCPYNCGLMHVFALMADILNISFSGGDKLSHVSYCARCSGGLLPPQRRPVDAGWGWDCRGSPLGAKDLSLASNTWCGGLSSYMSECNRDRRQFLRCERVHLIGCARIWEHASGLQRAAKHSLLAGCRLTIRSSDGMKGRGKQGVIPEKTRRPAASSSTIPTCENPGVNRPGIRFSLVEGEQANRLDTASKNFSLHIVSRPEEFTGRPTKASRLESTFGFILESATVRWLLLRYNPFTGNNFINGDLGKNVISLEANHLAKRSTLSEESKLGVLRESRAGGQSLTRWTKIRSGLGVREGGAYRKTSSGIGAGGIGTPSRSLQHFFAALRHFCFVIESRTGYIALCTHTTGHPSSPVGTMLGGDSCHDRGLGYLLRSTPHLIGSTVVSVKSPRRNFCLRQWIALREGDGGLSEALSSDVRALSRDRLARMGRRGGGRGWLAGGDEVRKKAVPRCHNKLVVSPRQEPASRADPLSTTLFITPHRQTPSTTQTLPGDHCVADNRPARKTNVESRVTWSEVKLAPRLQWGSKVLRCRTGSLFGEVFVAGEVMRVLPAGWQLPRLPGVAYTLTASPSALA